MEGYTTKQYARTASKAVTFQLSLVDEVVKVHSFCLCGGVQNFNFFFGLSKTNRVEVYPRIK